MGKLLPNYTNTGTIAVGQTTVSIPINNKGYERVWVIEQIGIQYSRAGDNPAATLMVNGSIYSGPAQMISQQGGLGQSFGGHPYLYAESDDDIEILVSNGTGGAVVTIQVQYRIVGYDHNELYGRFG